MDHDWARQEQPPNVRLTRRLNHEPCEVDLGFEPSPHAHVAAFFTLGGRAPVTFWSGEGGAYRPAADDLAERLERYADGLLYAAQELRRGPEPCE